MKRIHTLLLTAAVLLAGSACQPQKNPADYDRFVIEKTAVAADFEGGTASVVVNTNGNWTARFDQDYDWITANTLSGRGTGDILLTIAPNTGLEREATLVIEAPGYEPIVIAISQEAVKSNMRLGDPIPGTPPVKGVADAFTFQLPYVNALGNESVTLLLSFTGTGAAGLEAQTVTVDGFTAGEGQVTVTVKGTPTALGPMTLTAEVSGDKLEPLSVRTVEQIAYQHYINWNNWSIGWTRSDFNLLRGSAYDYSWTSEAVHATESGVGTDHIALPTGTINNSENYNGLFLATYDAARGVRRLSDDLQMHAEAFRRRLGAGEELLRAAPRGKGREEEDRVHGMPFYPFPNPCANPFRIDALFDPFHASIFFIPHRSVDTSHSSLFTLHS